MGGRGGKGQLGESEVQMTRHAVKGGEGEREGARGTIWCGRGRVCERGGPVDGGARWAKRRTEVRGQAG